MQIRQVFLLGVVAIFWARAEGQAWEFAAGPLVNRYFIPFNFSHNDYDVKRKMELGYSASVGKVSPTAFFLFRNLSVNYTNYSGKIQFATYSMYHGSSIFNLDLKRTDASITSYFINFHSLQKRVQIGFGLEIGVMLNNKTYGSSSNGITYFDSSTKTTSHYTEYNTINSDNKHYNALITMGYTMTAGFNTGKIGQWRTRLRCSFYQGWPVVFDGYGYYFSSMRFKLEFALVKPLKFNEERDVKKMQSMNLKREQRKEKFKKWWNSNND